MGGRQLISVAEFMRLRWQMLSERPVIEPPPLSPVIADPTFLGPDETPDGRWYLFFNGRNTAHWTRGREAIGAMYA